jgi:hypothetical protein
MLPADQKGLHSNEDTCADAAHIFHTRTSTTGSVQQSAFTAGARMIAYLILVHRYPQQFKRLFRAIYDPRNHYLVHIDKRSGAAMLDEVRDFLAPYRNAEVLPAKKAQWGGYSLVDAELRGIERLLEMGKNWSHFINLSGQDFPLRTQTQIIAHLDANPGREFIRVLDQEKIRPDTMARIRKYYVEGTSRVHGTFIDRRFLANAIPYIGTQWMIVSRQFCEFVSTDSEARRYKAFYRNTFIPDEGFFQTVMMNTTAHAEIVNDDLRMIDWIPDGDIKLRPRTYGAGDAAALIASRALFARKFDASVDSEILDILESHLAGHDVANADAAYAEAASAA